MAKVERTDDSWRKTRCTTCTDLRGDLDSTDYVENLSPLGKAPQLRRDSGSVSSSGVGGFGFQSEDALAMGFNEKRRFGRMSQCPLTR